MGGRGPREISPYWTRVEKVMRVQAGLMSVREAATALGVSRKHYYALEEKLLGAALQAVTPGRRGPRPKGADTREAELAAERKAAERERELLLIRMHDLEALIAEMKTRAQEAKAEKKGGRRRRRARARKPVHPGIQADGAGPGEAAGGEGKKRGSAVP